jgi:hypothetical protein
LTSIPTGSAVFRENTFQPETKLCLGWDLSDRVSFGANVNCAYASESGKRFTQFAASATFGFALTNRLGSFLELFSFLPGSRGGPNATYIDGGLTFLAHDDFQLDFRSGFGLNSTSPDYFVGIGAARRW